MNWFRKTPEALAALALQMALFDLCDDHYPVIMALSEKDKIGDEDSVRVAKEIARQCPQCRRLQSWTASAPAATGR